MSFPDLNNLCLWRPSRLQPFNKSGDLANAKIGTPLAFFCATADLL